MPTFSVETVVRAVLVWVLLMAAESAQGAVRHFLTNPAIDLMARQAGVVIGVLVIFAFTWLTFPWMRIRTPRGALAVGALWAAMTILFEVALGRSIGASWGRILSDYDLTIGGLMGLGLLMMALTPWLVLRLRGAPSPA